MDLFHSITQSLDSVLTCHWFQDFKNMDKQDKRMDTEPGGEQTQYVPTYAPIGALWTRKSLTYHQI